MQRRTIQRWLDERDEDLGIIGLEMGMAMDFENRGISMEKAIEDAKHMIGLDGTKHKPYTRNGKQFFRPWRNFWSGENAALEYMSHDVIGLTRKYMDRDKPYYVLTRDGLDWLGRQLRMKIYDKRE